MNSPTQKRRNNMSTRLSTYNKKLGNAGKAVKNWTPLPNTDKIFKLFYGVVQLSTNEIKKEQDNV